MCWTSDRNLISLSVVSSIFFLLSFQIANVLPTYTKRSKRRVTHLDIKRSGHPYGIATLAPVTVDTIIVAVGAASARTVVQSSTLFQTSRSHRFAITAIERPSSERPTRAVFSPKRSCSSTPPLILPEPSLPKPGIPDLSFSTGNALESKDFALFRQGGDGGLVSRPHRNLISVLDGDAKHDIRQAAQACSRGQISLVTL